MDGFWEILAVLAPVLAALGLGVLSHTKGWVSPEGVAGMKTLVMKFTLPAVLAGAFYKAQFSADFLVVAAAMMTCCVAGLGLGFLIRRLFRISQPLLPFLTTGFEAGMMGYGLYAMLFGAANLQPFAMVDLGQVLFVFTVYMALLNRQKGIGLRQSLLEMVGSPVFLAILAGVLLSATGLGGRLDTGPAGPAVAALLEYIAAPTGILMLFVVGYGLTWEVASLKSALAAAACRMVIMAGLCAGCIAVVGRLVPMTDGLFWAFVLMYSLPAPFVLPMFSGNSGEDAYVSTNLSLYALFSIAAFAVISVLKSW